MTLYSDRLYTLHDPNRMCLDRLNSFSNANHNNADMWINNSSEHVNQKLVFEPIGSNYRIRLSGKTNVYLVCGAAANGKGTGKATKSQGNFNTNNAAYTNRFDRGQCTWYCLGRAKEVLGKTITFNSASGLHGYTWYNQINNGTEKSQTVPKKNFIAVWSRNTYGHVAYVEHIDKDYVYFSEANYDNTTSIILISQLMVEYVY